MKNTLKRYLPNKEKLENHSTLGFLSNYLHDPNIWHLNRRSAAGGAAIGTFCAFIPFPVQTFFSAVFAIYFRKNLPLSVACSLISNPLTIPPMFFYAHKLGAWLLGIKHQAVQIEFSLEWLGHTFIEIWQPLILGCFVFATTSSFLIYLLIRIIWRYTAINKWLSRQKLKKELKNLDM